MEGVVREHGQADGKENWERSEAQERGWRGESEEKNNDDFLDGVKCQWMNILDRDHQRHCDEQRPAPKRLVAKTGLGRLLRISITLGASRGGGHGSRFTVHAHGSG